MDSGLGLRTGIDDIAQLGAGYVPPLGPTASSFGLEGRPGENLSLLAEAADLLAPPHRSTPQPGTGYRPIIAGLTPDQGTTRMQHASKANSEPPLDRYSRTWQSLRETDTTPTTNTATTSLLLPRAAASTPPARPTQPTYPPGAGAPISSHVFK